MLNTRIEMRATHHRTQTFFIISQLIETLAKNFNQEIKCREEPIVQICFSQVLPRCLLTYKLSATNEYMNGYEPF